jgi:hypothetical protein
MQRRQRFGFQVIPEKLKGFASLWTLTDRALWQGLDAAHKCEGEYSRWYEALVEAAFDTTKDKGVPGGPGPKQYLDLGFEQRADLIAAYSVQRVLDELMGTPRANWSDPLQWQIRCDKLKRAYRISVEVLEFWHRFFDPPITEPGEKKSRWEFCHARKGEYREVIRMLDENRALLSEAYPWPSPNENHQRILDVADRCLAFEASEREENERGPTFDR